MLFSLGKRISSVRVKFYVFFDKIKKSIGATDEERKDYADEPTGLSVKRWYFDNGNIKAEIHYKNGKMHGISTTFYTNGNFMTRENYNEDVLTGLSKSYFENGQCKSEKWYDQGRLIRIKEYSITGQLISSKEY